MKADAIKALLPAVFEDAVVPGSPLAVLLETMEAYHQPIEEILGQLDTYFDPRQCPPAFVPFLASWVGIDFQVTTGLGRMRELVARATALSRLRGTRQGLVQFLETATGVVGFFIDDAVPAEASAEGGTGRHGGDGGDSDGERRLFHIRVQAPSSLRSHERMILAIIEREKPAYVTSELVFTGAEVA